MTSLPRWKQGVASAMNDVSREVGSAIGIAVLGSLFNSGYRDSISPAIGALPDGVAHRVEESAGAGIAVAGQMEQGGEVLVTAVRLAFTEGLGDAMRAGAMIAAAAACFVAWRGPRRARSVTDIAAVETQVEKPPVTTSRSR